MSISFDFDSTYNGPAFPVIKLTIKSHAGPNEEVITAYIDTGSDASAIPISILEKIGARHVNRRFAKAIEGTRYAVDTYLASFQIGPLAIPGIEVIANVHTNESIIGRDILNQLHLSLDGLGLMTTIQINP